MSRILTRLVDCANTGAFLLPYLVAKAPWLRPRVLDLHRYREKRNPGGCCEAYSPLPRHFSELPQRMDVIALTLAQT